MPVRSGPVTPFQRSTGCALTQGSRGDRYRLKKPTEWNESMKMLSMFALVLGLTVAGATMCAVSMLMQLTELSGPHLTLEKITTGQAHHFFLARQTWEHVLLRPLWIASFVNLRAAASMGFLVLLIFAIWRRRLGRSYLTVGCCACWLHSFRTPGAPWSCPATPFPISQDRGWPRCS